MREGGCVDWVAHLCPVRRTNPPPWLKQSPWLVIYRVFIFTDGRDRQTNPSLNPIPLFSHGGAGGRKESRETQRERAESIKHKNSLVGRKPGERKRWAREKERIICASSKRLIP